MISNIDIKRSYIDLYKNLRNYFWDYYFVKDLVEFEDSILVKFPDMKRVRNILQRLYNHCKHVREEDECLQDSFSNMMDLVNNNDCEFSYIVSNVKE